ncbi:MAG TPA: hypothetical protein VHD37_00635 [Candidatus Paceibacterota bacterium]|nr:hypothetical protein [Candidatus Paceibacterota bacterium]
MLHEPGLPDFDPKLVEVARKRCALGANFCDGAFPGWRGRVRSQWEMIDLRCYDYCVLAVASWGQRGPKGEFLGTAGAVSWAFFTNLRNDGVSMGFYADEIINCDLLKLVWGEVLEQPDPPVQERQSPPPPPSLLVRVLTFLNGSPVAA